MEKEFNKAISSAKKAGRNEQTIYAMKRLFNGMKDTLENREYWNKLNFK